MPLSATPVQQYAGRYPGSTNYPGATAYPGRGTVLSATPVTVS